MEPVSFITLSSIHQMKIFLTPIFFFLFCQKKKNMAKQKNEQTFFENDFFENIFDLRQIKFFFFPPVIFYNLQSSILVYSFSSIKLSNSFKSNYFFKFCSFTKNKAILFFFFFFFFFFFVKAMFI